VIRITIPHYAPTLLRCALPLVLFGFVFDTIPSPTSVTLAVYVTTLPMWERAFLVYAMKKPIAAPLYQLVLQRMLFPSYRRSIVSVSATKDVTPVLVISNEGAIDDYGSFGWVARTDQEVL
jgi:hypothetical protein